MKRILLLVLVILLGVLSRPAFAQTTTSYILKYYNAGAPSPVQTETIQAASAVCNQVLPTIVGNVNPNKAIWNDPVNTGKFCIYTEATGGPLFSLPVGSYEGTLTATNVVGNSAESARVSFVEGAVPAAPTGLRIVQ